MGLARKAHLQLHEYPSTLSRYQHSVNRKVKERVPIKHLEVLNKPERTVSLKWAYLHKIIYRQSAIF